MTIEHAIARAKPKPWGSTDLRPWSQAPTSDGPIGELWFERPEPAAPKTELLLKLLFTTEPLSIQVHPNDTFAQSIGLPNGKTEAWYILSAIPGAKVAAGLNYPRSSTELRTAITDGSIANIVHGIRFIKATSFLFLPELFMRSAPVSFSRKSSSTATQRSGCLILDGSANCTSNAPSPRQPQGLAKFNRLPND